MKHNYNRCKCNTTQGHHDSQPALCCKRSTGNLLPIFFQIFFPAISKGMFTAEYEGNEEFAILDLELLDAVLDHAAEVRVGEAALDKLVLVQAAVTCTAQVIRRH